MNGATVGPRSAAQNGGCNCCGYYRRVAKIWIDKVGNVDVRGDLRLCSSCLRAGWDAAKKARK